MARRLFTLLSALSLLLCAAVLALWAWRRVEPAAARRLLDTAPVAVDFSSSEVVGPLPDLTRPVRPADYAIRSGDLLVVRLYDLYDLSASEATATKAQRVREDGTITLPFVGAIPARGRTTSDVEAAGVSAYESTNSLLRPLLNVWVVDERPRVRAALVAAALAVLPVGWVAANLVRRRRRHWRQSRGLCPSCAYDLRATPGRCPECGKTSPITS